MSAFSVSFPPIVQVGIRHTGARPKSSRFLWVLLVTNEIWSRVLLLVYLVYSLHELVHEREEAWWHATFSPLLSGNMKQHFYTIVRCPEGTLCFCCGFKMSPRRAALVLVWMLGFFILLLIREFISTEFITDSWLLSVCNLQTDKYSRVVMSRQNSQCETNELKSWGCHSV